MHYPTTSIGTMSENEWACVEDFETKDVPKKLYQIIREPQLPINQELGLTKFIKSKQYEFNKSQRICVALEGKLYEDARCSVYESRPKVCRDFPPASPQCNRIRKQWGLDSIGDNIQEVPF
jgi:Fe-S-cluster containining protein